MLFICHVLPPKGNPGNPVKVGSVNVTGWKSEVNTRIRMNRAVMSRAFPIQIVLFILNEKGGILLTWVERKCGLLSAKGGLMMGTKKVGALSSPRKRTKSNYSKKIVIVKLFYKFF